MRTHERIAVLAALHAIGMMTGCGSTDTRIDGRQFVEVPNPDAGKHVVFAMRIQQSCGATDSDCQGAAEQLGELQKKLESCLDRGLRATSAKSRLIYDWDASDDWYLHLGEKQPVMITGYDKKGKPIRVDYLVTIGVDARDSRKQSVAETDELEDALDALLFGGSADVPMWGVGQEWTISARMEGKVYEPASGVLAAELTAKLTKDAFWMVPVFGIVPLPPVGWVPNVDMTSCREMGKAVGRFLSGAGNNFLE
jgi:hypothetical protein